MKYLVALLAATVLLPVRAASAEAGALSSAEVSSYVDSVIEAYGGSKNIAKLARSRIEGTVEAHVRSKSGTFRRDLVAPDSLRVELAYPDRTEVRILAGKKGWRGSPSKQVRVEGFPHAAMVYQLLRAAAPWVVLEHRARLTHAADVGEGKGLRRVLRLSWTKTIRVDFWIEDTTRRITKVEGRLAVGHSSMFFATDYADFKEVDGVLVPHTEKSFVRGEHTGTTTITKVELGGKKLGPFAPSKPAKKGH